MSKWLIGLLAIAVALPASASTVFRWVDERGIVSFSDTAPTETIQPIERLEIRPGDTAPDPAVAERRLEMAKLADLLAKNRRERSAQRAISATPAPSAPAVVVVEDRHYGYGYPYSYRRQRAPRQRPIEVQRTQDTFPRNIQSPNWPAAHKRWGFD